MVLCVTGIGGGRAPRPLCQHTRMERPHTEIKSARVRHRGRLSVGLVTGGGPASEDRAPSVRNVYTRAHPALAETALCKSGMGAPSL